MNLKNETNQLYDLLGKFSYDVLAAALIPIAAKAAARADVEYNGKTEFYKVADNFKTCYEAELTAVKDEGGIDQSLLDDLQSKLANWEAEKNQQSG